MAKQAADHVRFEERDVLLSGCCLCQLIRDEAGQVSLIFPTVRPSRRLVLGE